MLLRLVTISILVAVMLQSISSAIVGDPKTGESNIDNSNLQNSEKTPDLILPRIDIVKIDDDPYDFLFPDSPKLKNKTTIAPPTDGVKLDEPLDLSKIEIDYDDDKIGASAIATILG